MFFVRKLKSNQAGSAHGQARKMARRTFRHIYRRQSEPVYQTSAELRDRRNTYVSRACTDDSQYDNNHSHILSAIVFVYVLCFVFFLIPATTTNILLYLQYSCLRIKTLTAELHGPYSVTLNDAAKLVQLGGAAPAKKYQPCRAAWSSFWHIECCSRAARRLTKQRKAVMLDLHTIKPTRKMAQRTFRRLHRRQSEQIYQKVAELHDRRDT